MDNSELRDALGGFEAAQISDGLYRAGRPVASAPAGLAPLRPGASAVGRALPARHAGGIDVFLEAYEHAEAGDVLVIDNDGRRDEACIGELVAREAAMAKLGGIVIWGLHRDHEALAALEIPVFSYGHVPHAPKRLEPLPPDALTRAKVGNAIVTREHVVVADGDGAVFFHEAELETAIAGAQAVVDREARFMAGFEAGKTLREQMDFKGYLAAREKEPGLGLREYQARAAAKT